MVAVASLPPLRVIEGFRGAPALDIEDWHPGGVLNLYGGFWSQVRKDLHPEEPTAKAAVTRANTLAWILDSETQGMGSFGWWCRLMDLDAEAWRAALLANTRLTQLPYAH